MKHTEATLRGRVAYLEKQARQLRAQIAAERRRGGAQHETVPLTRRQLEVLRFLQGYFSSHGYAPTFPEIAGMFGFGSLATVHEHLTQLERKGYIRRSHNAVRGIELLRGQTVAA